VRPRGLSVRDARSGIWFAMVEQPPKTDGSNPTCDSREHDSEGHVSESGKPNCTCDCGDGDDSDCGCDCSEESECFCGCACSHGKGGTSGHGEESGCSCGCDSKHGAEGDCDCDHGEDCDCDHGEDCDCDHGEEGDCDCDHGEDCDCGCDCEGEVDPGWLDEHAPAVDSPAPDEIVELVVACVRFVKDAFGIELDFTPDTLPVLDHYLIAARETLADRLPLRELVWRCAGAYFGEMVRRRYNGFWSVPNQDVHTWRVNQRHALLSFNPVGMVAEAMAGSDQGDGPTGALRLARPDQAEVARRLSEIPPLPEDQYYLLSTRIEVIETVVEHLRVRLDQSGQADFEFDPDDYANDLEPYGIA
jgi:hypothetical protein